MCASIFLLFSPAFKDLLFSPPDLEDCLIVLLVSLLSHRDLLEDKRITSKKSLCQIKVSWKWNLTFTSKLKWKDDFISSSRSFHIKISCWIRGLTARSQLWRRFYILRFWTDCWVKLDSRRKSHLKWKYEEIPLLALARFPSFCPLSSLLRLSSLELVPLSLQKSLWTTRPRSTDLNWCEKDLLVLYNVQCTFI